MRPDGQRRFDQRVVIVTGANSGLGRIIAHAFAREGATVVLAARNLERLRQTARELEELGHTNVLALPCDVTRREQVEELMAHCARQFGRIEILVNNAGTGLVAPFELISMEDALILFQTNFFGPILCTQAVLPHMKRQGSGHIVNVCSIAGLRGIPRSAVYSASKAALIAFSEALRIELQDSGIHITILCPGRISGTAFFERAVTYGPVCLYETFKPLSPEKVANALLAAVAGRKRLVILPWQARVMHFANQFAPRLIDWFLHKHQPAPERTDTP